MTSLRQEFADHMVRIGVADERVVVMVGDISHGILQPYARACAGRYFNIGICEPSMVNLAAGLNKVGLIPFVHTIAPFITERAFEQIKLDFGYQELGVNIVSVGGAFDYAQLGCSHHCYTDVSLISHMPRANVMLPSSSAELSALLDQTYDNGQINYYRLTEYAHDQVIDPRDIVVGRGITVRGGSDLTIATTGAQLRNVVAAAERLAADGFSCEVLYFHTLKPFDSSLLRDSVVKTGRLLSVEELSAHDGLHNLCLRAASQAGRFSARQIAIGDFVHGYGTWEDMCKRAGMDAPSITSAALRLAQEDRPL